MARTLNTSHALYANLVSLVGVEDDGTTIKDFKDSGRTCTLTGGSIGSGALGYHIATSNTGNNALGVALSPKVPFATTSSGAAELCTVVMVFNSITSTRGGSIRCMLGAAVGDAAAGNYPWIGALDTGEVIAGRGTNATALLTSAAATYIGSGAHMVAVSRNGETEAHLDVDGATRVTYTGAFGSGSDTNGYSLIGGYGEGSRGYRQSQVVWVAAFNKVLSTTEVADLYASLGADNTWGLFESVGGSTPVSFSGTVPNQNGYEDTPFSLALASYFSGTEIPFGYTVQAGTLPAGLTLGSDGTISGTPTTAGVSSGIVIRATDTGTDTADTNAFSITIEAAASNDPPTFSGPSISGYTITNEELMASDDVSALFTDTDALTFSALGTWPAGVTVSTAGVIGGTPTTEGTYTGLQVRATDTAAQTADSNTFTITVEAAPTAPTGTITTEPLKNNTGTVIASEAGVIVHIYNPTTGDKIMTVSGLTTNASGVLVITDSLLDPATEYRIVVVLASGAEGVARYTAT